MKNNLKKIYFKPHFYYETAQDFCLHLGWSVSRIEHATGITDKTIRKWLKNDTAPRWLLPYLYAVDGYLLSPGFNGWRFANGELLTPSMRHGLNAVQIDTYSWHVALFNERAYKTLQAEKKPLKAASVTRIIKHA